MLNPKNNPANSEKLHEAVVIHDINASLSALQGALELVKDEWRTNPELVAKILPLTLDKINQLQSQLIQYRHYSP